MFVGYAMELTVLIILISILYHSQMSKEVQSSKIYKFIFSAHVHTVSLALKFPCFVSISWRRGDKIAEVKQRKEIIKGLITFQQTLQLQCNMNFDGSLRKFQQKKTRFTVLIFSQKGNKQAGEVTYDVAEFLNTKQKEMKIEKTLEKCPDKNAKLIFTVSGYAKEEINQDDVSHKSDCEQPIATTAPTLQPTLPPQPDFKKKKPDNSSVSNQKVDKKVDEMERPKTDRLIIVKKQNKEKLKLQEQNKKLKQEWSQLRQLQIQNTTLRRRHEQAEKKAQSYYSKKLQEIKKELDQYKQKGRLIEKLITNKQQLEQQMCDCKQKMARILNFAIMSGNNDMIEEISNIYQNKKP